MKIRLLAGAAACAVLMCSSLPVSAATAPELPATALQVAPSTLQAIDAFYARHGEAPLWLRDGVGSNAARELIARLERARLYGFESGPALAAQAQALISRAQGGDPAALRAADRLLSIAWTSYVRTLQRPPAGIVFADAWVTPRQQSAVEILQRTAAARALAAYVQSVSQVNPLYAQLRDAAWSEMQSNGGEVDARVLASLERAREMPFQDKYVMVDTASARLYMVEGGQIVDSMKVAVGKPDPKTQTPMLASTIYYATLNPYWHVGPDLVRSLIAKNVLEQGVGYLKVHGYQVMSADPNDDELLDPAKVDWRAVADGSLQVRVRELPGPGNSMGRMKFGFPNAQDVYLHDTPSKELFSQDDRTISHGCVRLEDAERLARWMMGREPVTQSSAPEQNVALPTPVPIYLTYLTAQVRNGELSFVDDIYGRDSQLAALR